MLIKVVNVAIFTESILVFVEHQLKEFEDS